MDAMPHGWIVELEVLLAIALLPCIITTQTRPVSILTPAYLLHYSTDPGAVCTNLLGEIDSVN